MSLAEFMQMCGRSQTAVAADASVILQLLTDSMRTSFLIIMMTHRLEADVC